MTLRCIASVVWLALLSLTTSCSQSATRVPYYNDASFTPVWSPSTETLASMHTVPDFSLTNQHNVSFDSSALSGKPYVASFFFTTCPGICPNMTKNLKALQATLTPEKDKFHIVTFSVTPDLDTPSVLAKFVESKRIDDANWSLLTGERLVIYHLGRRAFFIEEDLGIAKKTDEFIHTENVVLVDGDGHLRGIYNGLNKASMATLVDDLRHLVENAL